MNLDSGFKAPGEAEPFRPPDSSGSECSATPVSDLVPPGVPVARRVDVGEVTTSSLPPGPLAAQLASPARKPLSRFRAVIELVVLIGFSFLSVWVVSLALGQWRPADMRYLNIVATLVVGLCCVSACILIIRIGGRKLEEIGLTFRRFGLHVGIGLAALPLTYVVLSQITFGLLLFWPDLLNQPNAQQGIENAFPRMSFLTLVGMNLAVVIWEEVVFRGFVLTRVQAVLRRWWLTVPLVSVFFGGLHLYEGPLAVVMITLLALVMSFLFVWRKSLVPSIVFHFAHNLLIFQVLKVFSTTWT